MAVQKYESSTGIPVAEPLAVALVQRGVRDTDVLNHLVMHARRLNTNASVCVEVRNIMLTRATLMNTVQAVDIGTLDKEKGKVTRSEARRRANSQLEADEEKRMRTSQTRMFSASTAGRREET